MALFNDHSASEVLNRIVKVAKSGSRVSGGMVTGRAAKCVDETITLQNQIGSVHSTCSTTECCLQCCWGYRASTIA